MRPCGGCHRVRQIRFVGVVLIDFNEAKHEYRVGGRVLPSVTRILVGAGLLKAFGDEADLQRGRAVHEATRMWELETLDPRSVDPLIQGYLDSWIRFRTFFKMKLTYHERKVSSVRYGYAGRYDNEVLLDAERCILEKKTGEIQELAVRLQLAAYAEARRIELRRPRIRKEPYGRIAVRLFPDGQMAKLEKFPATDFEQDFRGFLSALNLYKLKEKYNQ